MNTVGPVTESTTQIAPAPPGMVFLISSLAIKFGAESIVSFSFTEAMEQGAGFQVIVPVDQVDEASIFVTELSLQVEDQYGESYPVRVSPGESWQTKRIVGTSGTTQKISSARGTSATGGSGDATAQL